MEPEILKKLDSQQAQLDAIFASTEKTRKYLLITAWVTVAVIVLPLLGLIFVIPSFLDTVANTQELLSY